MYINYDPKKLVEVENKKGCYTAASFLDSLYPTTFELQVNKTPKRLYVYYKGREMYTTISSDRNMADIIESVGYINERVAHLIKTVDKMTNSPLFLRDYPEEAA